MIDNKEVINKIRNLQEQAMNDMRRKLNEQIFRSDSIMNAMKPKIKPYPKYKRIYNKIRTYLSYLWTALKDELCDCDDNDDY